jgi:hypothetical protein
VAYSLIQLARFARDFALILKMLLRSAFRPSIGCVDDPTGNTIIDAA